MERFAQNAVLAHVSTTWEDALSWIRSAEVMMK
jgi:hypothetical protein